MLPPLPRLTASPTPSRWTENRATPNGNPEQLRCFRLGRRDSHPCAKSAGKTLRWEIYILSTVPSAAQTTLDSLASTFNLYFLRIVPFRPPLLLARPRRGWARLVLQKAMHGCAFARLPAPRSRFSFIRVWSPLWNRVIEPNALRKSDARTSLQFLPLLILTFLLLFPPDTSELVLKYFRKM